MAAGVTAQSAATKWNARASVAGPDYVAGAVAAAATQAANAIAQAQSWLQGVNQVGVKGFTDGVNASAQSGKYASRINAVGSGRYTSGVAASVNLFTAQIGKVLAVETQAVGGLSPKGPKGSPADSLRSTEMQTALRQAKLNGQFK